MALLIHPVIGVPLPDAPPVLELPERTAAAAETTKYLACGQPIEITPADELMATEIAHAFAKDPEKAARKVDKARDLTPASLVVANNILKEFGHAVAQDAVVIRHVVTNKLLIEADNPDARIRMKALELLGKISDVGLFTEKREVTVTHQSTDELRDSLRNKLSRMLEGETVEDAEVISVDPIAVEKKISALDEFEPDEEVYEEDPVTAKRLAALMDEWDD